MNTSKFAGPIYPAKSGRIKLIDLLKDVEVTSSNAGRVSVPKPIFDRVFNDLEHAVQLLDALQVERANAHDMLSVLEAVAEYAANQMWHLKGGANGSDAQTLYNQIEAAIAKARQS